MFGYTRSTSNRFSGESRIKKRQKNAVSSVLRGHLFSRPLSQRKSAPQPVKKTPLLYTF